MPKKNVDKLKAEKTNKTDNTENLIDTIESQEKTILKLREENSKNNNALEILQKQFLDMQSLLLKMQIGNSTPSKPETKLLSLGCRLFNGVTLYSPKREVEFRVPFNEQIEITEDEMQMIMKTGFVRDFLKKDIVYFVDDENYKKYKIFDRYDLSDERIIAMVLQSKQNQLVTDLNKYTNEKKDDPVFHSLFYRIVGLYNDGKLSSMSYENRKTIEGYFGFEISNAQLLLHRFKNVV
jgi:hypothetical protein